MSQSITLDGKTLLDVYLEESNRDDVVLTIATDAMSVEFLGVSMEQLKQLGSFITLYVTSRERETSQEDQ